MKFNPRTGLPYIDPETGKPYVEHEYSDTLLLKLLAARMPQTYGNKIEHTERRVHLTLDELEQRRRDADA